MAFFSVILELLVAVAALSESAKEQLKNYLRPGDEVVLLELKNPKQAINLKNYRNYNSENRPDALSDGHCFGLTQAELGLLNIEFKPGLRDDNEIFTSVVKAARGAQKQVIHGYTAEEFALEMTQNFSKDENPYRRAVEFLQREHQVQIKANGNLRVGFQNPDSLGLPQAPVFRNEEIKDAQRQAEEFMASIDRGIPIWASSFPIDKESPMMTEVAKSGHAFIVVGYIKNPTAPTRLIVKDTNPPSELRVLEGAPASSDPKRMVWKDLDTRTSSKNPVNVIIGAQEIQNASSVASHFTKTSTQNSGERIALNPTVCQPKVGLSNIFEKAQH